MTRPKRGNRALPSGSPKSPRVLLDADADSAAADRGAPATGEGPRIRAPSNQVQHQPQSPSITAPTTPQRQVRSMAFVAAAPHRPSPPHLRLRAQPQLAAPGPAARFPTSAPHHGAVRPSPPLPSSGVTTVPGPQTPRRQAAAGTIPSSAAANRRMPGSWSAPPRPRTHTPSPPPGSPSSSASSGPSNMSLDSSGSVMPTYASIVRGPANQNSDANLSSRLLNFLKAEFSFNSEMTACHMEMEPIISLMAVAGRFNLVVVFKRLLKYDKELAFAICNCQDRFNEWVDPTVSQFLTSIGLAKNVAETMKLTFSGMPHSIKPLEDFIREQPLASKKSIFGGSFQLCIANDFGMMLVHGFLVEVFNRHLQDLTWNGRFSLSDMVVVNSTQCVIIKEPMRDESHCIAEDLHKIGDIFMPMFECDGEMALYFDVLKRDLKRANKNLVREEWFWVYLLSHLALKQSMARYHLEYGLKHAAKIHGGQGTLLQSVLGGHSDWKALIPTELTEDTLPTDVILHDAFWFKHERTEGVKDRFEATVGGLLNYKRNFLEHGEDYVQVEDLSELEQFAAKTFPQALPNFLWSLLRDCKIHMGGPFNELWRVYHPLRGGRWQ
ncbi:unnamed protein product [Urochloa humidicola]